MEHPGGGAAQAAGDPASRSPLPPVKSRQFAAVALRLKEKLDANPHDAQALMGMSLVAQASGQAQAALEMAQAAVTAAPESCAAWITLGQALKSAGRLDEAESAYRSALKLDGASALARAGLGELCLAAGLPERALHEYETALLFKPVMVAAQLGLGHALACMGQNESALERYEHVLALRPRSPEAEFAAGFVLARLGRNDDAQKHYRRALAARPDFAAAWMNLGNLLRERSRWWQAESALKRAVALRPDLISGWLNLALLERECSRPDKAAQYLDHALEVNPENVETLVAYCQFRVAERDLPGAWKWLAKAIVCSPRHAEAVNMLGILLHSEGQFEEAVSAFTQAEELGSSAATSNRGNSLLELGRDEDALHAHEEAVARDPHSAGALYNLALTRLRLGDWQRSWSEYEARWRLREVHRTPRVFAQQRWRGEPLEGRRILLHAEQGLGDTIQFSRYAALVAARGGSVILEVQEAVERLMHSLDVVRRGDAQVVRMGAPLPAFDLECPLMSLPAVFNTTVETVPSFGAYLAADPALAAFRLNQLARRAGNPRIGIAWAGNPRYKADKQRSMHLKTLLPLLESAGVEFISLQKGEAARQLEGLLSGIGLVDGASRDKDLADTAALIDQLDLVITTDTSIAHLAGAMAKPVWILLPHVADWRWMQHRETTPWYPTARLFRQREPGNWPEVLERVACDLSHHFSSLLCAH